MHTEPGGLEAESQSARTTLSPNPPENGPNHSYQQGIEEYQPSYNTPPSHTLTHQRQDDKESN